MGKIILIINLLFTISISCQEIIVEMKDNDSIKINKINKNEYGIYIYIYIRKYRIQQNSKKGCFSRWYSL